jgi:hypothetical protein
MALNIKDREAERLAAGIAAMTGESNTRAVKVALQERRQRPALRVGNRDRGRELCPRAGQAALRSRPRRAGPSRSGAASSLTRSRETGFTGRPG